MRFMKKLEKLLIENHSGIFFEDWIEFLKNPNSNFIEREFIPVYWSYEHLIKDNLVFCFELKSSLFHLSETGYLNNLEKNTEFAIRHPNLGDNKIQEDFVITRYHQHTPNKQKNEIIQKFKMNMNLYEKENGYKTDLFYYDHNQYKIDISKYKEDHLGERVLIHSNELRKFLYDQNCYLKLWGYVRRYSKKNVKEEGETRSLKVKNSRYDFEDYIKKPNLDFLTYYRICATNTEPIIIDKSPQFKSISQFWFFHLIKGIEYEKYGEDEYEEFEFYCNEEKIKFTCNPSKLSNYYGKNKDNPKFLTPVFFKRTVLKKYYDSPHYRVEDGRLSQNGNWGLKIDMNTPRDYIGVYLGDLAELPYKEQQYFKSYNICDPDYKMSHVNFQRSFMVKFEPPSDPGLIFQEKYHFFLKKWREKYRWNLFKPEGLNEIHHLRVPLDESDQEFITNVRYLHKSLIESLDVKEIKKQIKHSSNDIDLTDKKSIQLLDIWLSNSHEKTNIIDFLKLLQNIRNECSHHWNKEKSKCYRKLVDYFLRLPCQYSLNNKIKSKDEIKYLEEQKEKIQNKNTQNIFECLLLRGGHILHFFEKIFLTS